MDIVGILLLFFCGGIGGQWMSQPGVVNWPGIGATEGEIARDERWARRGAYLGLALAVSGFGLQIWAQWI